MIKHKVEPIDRAVKKLNDAGQGTVIIIQSHRTRLPGAELLGYRGQGSDLWPVDREQWPEVNGTVILFDVWSDEEQWREERKRRRLERSQERPPV